MQAHPHDGVTGKTASVEAQQERKGLKPSMNVTALDNASLQVLMTDDKNVLLLDVRTPEEFYGLGHIPGARLLPLWELPEAIPSLDAGQKTVLICEHGVRSADAAAYMTRFGFRNLYNLTAGMAEWDGPRIFE